MPKKKARKKAKKKTTTLQRDMQKEPHWLLQRRKRLRLPMMGKEMSLLKAYDAVQGFDYAMLEDKNADIERRDKIFRRAEDFEALLKERYGRRARVKFYFDDETDELRMIAYFRPKAHEHPMDADEVILEAFKIAKLGELMDNVGSGTFLQTMQRDHDFVEKKPRTKKS